MLGRAATTRCAKAGFAARLVAARAAGAGNAVSRTPHPTSPILQLYRRLHIRAGIVLSKGSMEI
jgi:hypothetical protein